MRLFTKRVIIKLIGTNKSPDSFIRGEGHLSISYRRASKVVISYLINSILDKLNISVKVIRAFPLLYKLEDIIIRIENNK